MEGVTLAAPSCPAPPLGSVDTEFLALFDLLPMFNTVLQAVESADTPADVGAKVHALQEKIAQCYASLDAVDDLAGELTEKGCFHPQPAIHALARASQQLKELKDTTLPSLIPPTQD